jgi:hypothetical protein
VAGRGKRQRLELGRGSREDVRMPELWRKLRWPRRVLLVLAAGALGAGLIVGLGEGRGAAYHLTPSAFPVITTLPAHKQSEATVGKPRFDAKPPTADLTADLLPSDGIPAVALDAYEAAAGELTTTDPGCQIDWEDLAGIGRVESDNGQTWGGAAHVTAQGTLYPPIYGPLLDGSDGFPAIPSPDAGRMEGGGVWARAVGPMQFLPSTWLAYARSDIGDSPPDPQNFYDAALSAGQYLCVNGGNLASQKGITAAVYAYNHVGSYVTLVEEWITFYQQEGATALLAAGAGELPIGAGDGGGGASSTTVSTGSGVSALVSAAATTDAKGSFQFTLDCFEGQSYVANGSGGVDFAAHEATVTLVINGIGTVYMRVFGTTAYISLPGALASDVGAEGPWIVLSRTVLSRLPQLLERGLGALAEDLVFVIAQLAAGESDVQEAAQGTIVGVPATEYIGTINLSQAATLIAGAKLQLVAAAALLGGFNVGVDVWVDTHGLVRAGTLSLPAIPGGVVNEPFSVDLLFSGFGSPVNVTVPPVSGVTTTSTTSSSTSTSTSTSTSSTTTSSSTTTTTSSTTSSTTGPSGNTGTGATGGATP